jgi:hypothetical protein
MMLLALMLAGLKVETQAVDRCHWVEGRLTVGNGTPAVRIWPRGTRRLLGVTTSAG